MNVSGPDFSSNGIRTESQLKLHKVMSAPTLLDGSKSLDVEEEKIRKKNYGAFKHCEIIPRIRSFITFYCFR